MAWNWSWGSGGGCDVEAEDSGRTMMAGRLGVLRRLVGVEGALWVPGSVLAVELDEARAESRRASSSVSSDLFMEALGPGDVRGLRTPESHARDEAACDEGGSRGGSGVFSRVAGPGGLAASWLMAEGQTTAVMLVGEGGGGAEKGRVRAGGRAGLMGARGRRRQLAGARRRNCTGQMQATEPWQSRGRAVTGQQAAGDSRRGMRGRRGEDSNDGLTSSSSRRRSKRGKRGLGWGCSWGSWDGGGPWPWPQCRRAQLAWPGLARLAVACTPDASPSSTTRRTSQATRVQSAHAGSPAPS